jgi:hypothetical protein
MNEQTHYPKISEFVGAVRDAASLDDAVQGSVPEEEEQRMGLLGRDPAQVVVRMAARIEELSEALREKEAEIERLKATTAERLMAHAQTANDADQVIKDLRRDAREMARAIGNALDVYRNGSYDGIAYRIVQQLEGLDCLTDYVDGGE